VKNQKNAANIIETTETVIETPEVELEITEVSEIPEPEVPETPAPIEYRTTSTGRPTLVGTRHCSECSRAEFHTKKFEKSQNPDDLNQRYTLCKGVCVYCYAAKRNKSAGSSLSVAQLEAKIKFYTDLLANTRAAEAEVVTPETVAPEVQSVV
jgi:sulfatase maturation enzyme AslB (radical SAM superfamily)